MSSRSTNPEIVVLLDSDEEESEREGPAARFSENRSQTQQQPPTSGSQPASTPNVLQEILDIVQWVNTGVKRETICEKTFMEKKFEEMERTIKEKDGLLEKAHLDICVLKKVNLALETENVTLKKQLENESKEKAEMKEKWIEMKTTFQSFQTKYFEDTPVPEVNIPSAITQMKEELAVDPHVEEKEMGIDVPVSSAPASSVPTATTELQASSTVSPASSQPGTSQVVFAEIGEAVMELQDEAVESFEGASGNGKTQIPTSSSSPNMISNNPRRRCRKEDKNHGVDTSRKDEGTFCRCGLKFTSKRNLDSHVIYFTCDKKFVCSICQKRFVGSNYLKGHMLRSHKVNYTGGLNGCRDCGKTFSTLLQLRRHKKLAHYPSTNIGKLITTTKQSDTAAAPSSSSRNRRSIRMRRRHQKGEVNTALKLLQGNCSNCQFCREQKQKKKSLKSISSVVHQHHHHHPMPSTSTGSARVAARTISRSSSCDSCESVSFSCEFCQKWFGDDRSGLIKHQQSCQKK